MVTPEQPPAGALSITAGLLAMLGASTSDAAHLASAIAGHRKAMRLEGVGVPASLDVLERVFAMIAIGPRRVSEGHRGSEVGADDVPPDHDHVTDTSLLTRAQAAARMRCSVSSVKRRERDGALTPIRHGRVVRHRVADIDAYLTRSTDADL